MKVLAARAARRPYSAVREINPASIPWTCILVSNAAPTDINPVSIDISNLMVSLPFRFSYVEQIQRKLSATP